VNALAIDTIVAPATPIGRSALAIVRIDGPLSVTILSRLASVSVEPRTATLAHLRHNGQLLDQCILTLYAAPHSFT
jgi:tRNA modification GTPase